MSIPFDAGSGVQKAYRKLYWWYYQQIQKPLAGILRHCPGSSESFGPPRYTRSSLKEVLPGVVSMEDLLNGTHDAYLQTSDGTEMVFESPKTLPEEKIYMTEVAGTFHQPAALLFLLHGARLIDGAGTVVTSRDELFAESSPWGIENIRSNGVNHQLIPSKPAHLDGMYIHATGVWTHGYFHWIFDTLTRLVPLLKYPGIKNLPLIVPRAVSELHRETLSALGFNCLIPQPSEHVRVEKLLFPTAVRATHCPPKWVLDNLRQHFGVKTDLKRHRRIYISREDATSRRVVNEGEVMDCLKPFGFEKFRLSGKTLKEQREIFNEAEFIVGPNGSGFTNLLYVLPGARALELFAPTYFHGAPSALAATLGIDYTYLVGDAVNETDMQISIAKLMAVMKVWGLT